MMQKTSETSHTSADIRFYSNYILAEDLILNPKDHPDAKIGDVVEIYLPEDDGIRLLLQITSFQEDKKGTKGLIDP